MTESITDRYRRRAASFTETVEAVPPDAWSNSSPCSEWTALDLVEHVVKAQGMFADFVGESIEPGPAVADDALAAWVAARDQTQAFLDDPEVAGREFDGMTGKSTYQDGVDRFLAFDLVAHRWDLARATGSDDTIPPADVEDLAAAVEVMSAQYGDAMRGPGGFGPELTPPDGSDAQTRMLAALGRQAW